MCAPMSRQDGTRCEMYDAMLSFEVGRAFPTRVIGWRLAEQGLRDFEMLLARDILSRCNFAMLGRQKKFAVTF